MVEALALAVVLDVALPRGGGGEGGPVRGAY
jgi:hypothetical protein